MFFHCLPFPARRIFTNFDDLMKSCRMEPTKSQQIQNYPFNEIKPMTTYLDKAAGPRAQSTTLCQFLKSRLISLLLQQCKALGFSASTPSRIIQIFQLKVNPLSAKTKNDKILRIQVVRCKTAKKIFAFFPSFFAFFLSNKKKP